jgi:hypothetical protein
MVFGPSIAGIHLRSGVGASVASALASYVLTLAAVYVLALIVTGLAPLFDGAADRLQALKLVAYAGVPLWLAGLFSIYPTLGFVMGMLGALYSLWLLYLGLPRLMSAPAARTLTYFAAVLVVTILIGVGLRMATLLIP